MAKRQTKKTKPWAARLLDKKGQFTGDVTRQRWETEEDVQAWISDYSHLAPAGYSWEAFLVRRSNPAAAKVPMLRRQDAIELATEVAMKGWKHHGGRGSIVEYWEKAVPGGHVNVVRAKSMFKAYALEYVGEDGAVTSLGNASRGASLDDAKLQAVLEASRKGLRVVNPQRARNLAPSRARWIGGAIKHPGKLSKLAEQLGFEKKPFMSRSLAEQKRILDACVEEYGYRSCLGSAMLLHNLPSISRSPPMRTRATALKDYLVTRYGGHGSFGPRSNPAHGEWNAVPAILMHVDISKAKLTATQITQLTLETA
jgi:hypothetical protein